MLYQSQPSVLNRSTRLRYKSTVCHCNQGLKLKNKDTSSQERVWWAHPGNVCWKLASNQAWHKWITVSVKHVHFPWQFGAAALVGMHYYYNVHSFLNISTQHLSHCLSRDLRLSTSLSCSFMDSNGSCFKDNMTRAKHLIEFSVMWPISEYICLLSTCFQYTLKRQASLLTSIVPWRTFNIHGTFQCAKGSLKYYSH